MSKKTLYRKWRPSQLDEVVGQRHVVATIKQASIHNAFSQAYMFSGERGTGKTSVGRIAASLMTCEQAKDGKVCGKCRACQTIHEGVCLDVNEIDAAKNRGVDNITSIIDAASWSPQELSRKIYIIDECHMLSKEAIAALLKTLEEPPSYLHFILCTTEADKILPTILSRCQRFNFSKITSKDISKRLLHIAQNEGIKVDEEGAGLMAKMARGSMRDAIGYLEQIGTVASGKPIVAKHIQQYFGLSDRTGIFSIVKAMIEGNIPLVLDQVNDLIMASVDTKQIMFEISEVFRNAMLLKAQDGNARLIDLPDNEINELKKMIEGLSMSQLLKLAHLFSDVEKKMSFNINERWITEATLINCVASLRK